MSSSSVSFPRPCALASDSTSNPCELPCLVGLTTSPLPAFRPGAEFTSLASCLPLRARASYQRSGAFQCHFTGARGTRKTLARPVLPGRGLILASRACYQTLPIFPSRLPLQAMLYEIPQLLFTGLAFQPVPLKRVRSPNRNFFRRFDRKLLTLTTSR